MAEEILELTMKEADRLKVIWQVISKQLKVRQAAEQLDLSCRQVLRLTKRVKKEGNRRGFPPQTPRPPNGDISILLVELERP